MCQRRPTIKLKETCYMAKEAYPLSILTDHLRIPELGMRVPFRDERQKRLTTKLKETCYAAKAAYSLTHTNAYLSLACASFSATTLARNGRTASRIGNPSALNKDFHICAREPTKCLARAD